MSVDMDELDYADPDYADMEADMAYDRMRDNDSDAFYTDLEALFQKWLNGRGYYQHNASRIVEHAIDNLRTIAKVNIRLVGENIYANEKEDVKATVDYVTAEPKDQVV